MLRRLARHVTALYDEHLRSTGLKLTQYAVLARLHRLGNVSLVALARESDLDVTSMSRAIRPLVSSGLVHVGAGPDARTKAYALTEAGKQTYAVAHEQWERAEAALRAIISPAQRRELAELTAAFSAGGAR